MSAGYRSWTGPARVMARAVDDAVTAAQAAKVEDFGDALSALAAVDREQLAVLLGATTRDLLERTHPDGLDSEDAGQVVRGCVAGAAWYSPLDVDAVVRALMGSLGMVEAPADGAPDDGAPDDGAPDDDAPPPLTGPVVVAHGLLLIASLLTAAGETLPSVLEPALQELRRAQTVELP